MNLFQRILATTPSRRTSTRSSRAWRNVDDHGFIHPEFMQCVTATGRLSSRNPNFQNMPRGNTFAIRKAVESRFEGGLIMEDYSQLEFRVAGFLVGTNRHTLTCETAQTYAVTQRT